MKLAASLALCTLALIAPAAHARIRVLLDLSGAGGLRRAASFRRC